MQGAGSNAATAQEQQLAAQRAERAAARKREQMTYQFAAIAATTLITATAGFATYYRCGRAGWWVLHMVQHGVAAFKFWPARPRRRPPACASAGLPAARSIAS